MIENDRLEPAFRVFFEGDGQQAIDLVTFRDIANQVLMIIGAVRQLFLKSDLTAGDLQLSQVIDGDLTADFYFRRGWRDRAGW